MGERAKTTAVTEIKDFRDWLAAAEAGPDLQRRLTEKWGHLFKK